MIVTPLASSAIGITALRDEALAIREPLRGDCAGLDASLEKLSGAAGEP